MSRWRSTAGQVSESGTVGLKVRGQCPFRCRDRSFQSEQLLIPFGCQSPYDFEYDLAEYEKGWFEGLDAIRSYELVDSEHLINKYLDEGKSVLAEGAQGTMLDIDFGSYPYVTSSNTITAGACTGLGIAPRRIGKVFGVFKAYCTRVGGGPFPTEELHETGELIRKHGAEYGATTGRPRRCGWLDLPLLKYAIMLNGVTDLMMTKADVLSHFDTVKVCTSYRLGNETVDFLPYDISRLTEPVFAEFPSWKTDISGITRKEDLPVELLNYIKFIEKSTGVPVSFVSLGPNRKEFVER